MNTGFKISKNKAWEFETGRFEEWSWFRFNLDLTRNCDHAGFRINIEVLGVWVEFSIYDTRHWSYEQNKWEEHQDHESCK